MHVLAQDDVEKYLIEKHNFDAKTAAEVAHEVRDLIGLMMSGCKTHTAL